MGSTAGNAHLRSVSKRYLPWTPEQAYLLPPSPMEWLPSPILYAYCTGTFSSRKIERGTRDDVALRVIGGGEQARGASHASLLRHALRGRGGTRDGKPQYLSGYCARDCVLYSPVVLGRSVGDD